MTEGEYLAVVIMGGMFLFLFALLMVIGVWVVRHRRDQKHQEAFFAAIDEKRERQKKRVKQSIGQRYGS